MFRFYLTNFGYYSQMTATTLEQAREIARGMGFETTVEKDGKVVGSWSPIGGWKNFEG